jgi:hypothetical protein
MRGNLDSWDVIMIVEVLGSVLPVASTIDTHQHSWLLSNATGSWANRYLQVLPNVRFWMCILVQGQCGVMGCIHRFVVLLLQRECIVKRALNVSG